ncbi:mas-related G-protein coupled receptor member F-like [Tachyglossus aculeatus]|uniref:mas-related G-protein coupled receptor member F-like n=1 Tax=Tachyglossus aculeatus TaxID=9261 RepID=UPI0018F30275|nr:mas-related G-protein coupled receptor member F-like [Tachyglossus aculeatus]
MRKILKRDIQKSLMILLGFLHLMLHFQALDKKIRRLMLHFQALDKKIRRLMLHFQALDKKIRRLLLRFQALNKKIRRVLLSVAERSSSQAEVASLDHTPDMAGNGSSGERGGPPSYLGDFVGSESLWPPAPAPAAVSCLLLLVCLAGLLGNVLALYLLGFRVPRNPFTVYVLHLAAADLAVVLSLASRAAVGGLGSPGGPLATYLRSLATAAGLWAFVAGVSLLAALSAERCAAVLCPRWHRGRRPPHLAATTCALLWALSLVLTAAHTYLCAVVAPRGPCGRLKVALGGLTFLGFTPIMVLSSLALLVRAECGAPRARGRRLSRVVLLAVSAFLFCSLFMSVNWFLAWAFALPAPYPGSVVELFACGHCGAKPVVYFLAGRARPGGFGEPLALVLRRALDDDAEPGPGDGFAPNTVSLEMQSETQLGKGGDPA